MNDDQFESIFSPTENTMGQDLYQSGVEVNKSIAQYNVARAERISSVSAIAGMSMLSFVLAVMLPAGVWLWRWALA